MKPRCPVCHKPMHMGSDGFYFHDGLACSIRATLDPIDSDGNDYCNEEGE